MKNPGRIRHHFLWPGFSLALGLTVGVLVLGLMLTGSDGTEPRGVCTFVRGDAGHLSFDPNEGGTYSYSCDLNMTLAAFYILVPGSGLAVLFYLAARIFRFSRSSNTEQRPIRNDTGSPAVKESRPE